MCYVSVHHTVNTQQGLKSQLTGYCNLGSAERKSGSKTTNMSNLSTAQTKTHHYGHRV